MKNKKKKNTKLNFNNKNNFLIWVLLIIVVVSVTNMLVTGGSVEKIDIAKLKSHIQKGNSPHKRPKPHPIQNLPRLSINTTSQSLSDCLLVRGLQSTIRMMYNHNNTFLTQIPYC